MSHTSMILSSLLIVALLLFVAPNIFAINRGRILRNIALWLAIFLGLALIYKSFGPESAHPLFNAPAAFSDMKKEAIEPVLEPKEDQEEKKNTASPVETPAPTDPSPSDESDFSPPND
ncbi:MAG: hypothetical protein PHS57_06555 [Alphaproteobacteria bacterium]|nr:hypothetical protein [Alphaproteobacteria bacterium]